MNALILAGSSNNGALQECSSSKYETLINICSRPMVEHVIKGVRKSKFVDKIILVGPVADLKKELQVEPDVYIEMSDSLFENIKKGVADFSPDELILIVTGDIPLISPEAIDDFIEKAQKDKGDIYYPLVSKEICEAAYPNMKRTYIRLKDGVYTGGNIVLLKPKVITDMNGPLSKAIQFRKSPWQLSKLLGFMFVFLFVTGKLSIERIEKKVSRTFGYNGVGLITNYPEIAFDVDKPSDLELVTQFIAGNGIN